MRPTEEILEEVDGFAETGVVGCLMPSEDAVGDTEGDTEE
jgi:hypothetical protein